MCDTRKIRLARVASSDKFGSPPAEFEIPFD
jgi:hypothetical protein